MIGVIYQILAGQNPCWQLSLDQMTRYTNACKCTYACACIPHTHTHSVPGHPTEGFRLALHNEGQKDIRQGIYANTSFTHFLPHSLMIWHACLLNSSLKHTHLLTDLHSQQLMWSNKLSVSVTLNYNHYHRHKWYHVHRQLHHSTTITSTVTITAQAYDATWVRQRDGALRHN